MLPIDAIVLFLEKNKKHSWATHLNRDNNSIHMKGVRVVIYSLPNELPLTPHDMPYSFPIFSYRPLPAVV